MAESAQRLTHRLRLVDESTPTRRARPKGVARAEVLVALTAPNEPSPSDIAAYRYVECVTDGTATLSFAPADGGKQAHYITRWVNTSGATSKWSDRASAKEAACRPRNRVTLSRGVDDAHKGIPSRYGDRAAVRALRCGGMPKGLNGGGARRPGRQCPAGRPRPAWGRFPVQSGSWRRNRKNRSYHRLSRTCSCSC